MSDRRARSPRAAGLADGVAAAVRRRQRERQPRVVLYDGTGDPHVLVPSAPGYDELLDVADQMVALLAEGQRADEADEEPAGTDSELASLRGPTELAE